MMKGGLAVIFMYRLCLSSVARSLFRSGIRRSKNGCSNRVCELGVDLAYLDGSEHVLVAESNRHDQNTGDLDEQIPPG